jgi:predicted lactoylglutathione lyase
MRQLSAFEFPGGRVIGYGAEKPIFWINSGAALRDHVHVAFAAASRADVDAFYKAAMAAGGRDNGPPGIREDYHPNYYAAFVLDPDGHNIEAVCHAPA